jgi:hypothetical protein
MGAAMAIGTHGDDRIRRIRSSIRKTLDVMHLQIGLVVKYEKWGRSSVACLDATIFTGRLLIVGYNRSS